MPSFKRSQDPQVAFKEFIKASPQSRYTFDSERDAPESELCREPGKGLSKECIILQMESKKLFESMQNMGFFCALPIDPGKTHMECTPIPK
ncbi:hypothetical protein SISSUDRAFT_1039218 [Sistotremastrum suecicum HHB10207 ss-3]|uniref:Uncharacterized protein n=1 Tax=Sistotremastrum suecicum HHB10207 ss-3 TaxID=1314776 RepID=A0A166IQC6_9AGAM|nr:hypothetical protein SISSUDRAFT_1039218 [Sistotremastrum suecicum HHB10207 ss-3]